MITLFGTTYYTWLAPYPLLIIIALLIIMIPMFMFDHWIKTRRVKIPKITIILILIILGIEIYLFKDVYWIGQEAKRLCDEEGGLHVYKTVEVNGFAGTSSIEYWSKQGFEFVEHGSPQGKLYKLTMENGHVNKQEINIYSNPYHINTREDEILNRYMGKSEYVVSNRKTGEILGKLVKIFIYPGKIDAYLWGKTGFTFIPWVCGGEFIDNDSKKKVKLTSSDLILATLKPKSAIKK